MKRFLLMSLLTLILLPAHAQLKVTKNGQSIFGKHMYQSPLITPKLSASEGVAPLAETVFPTNYVPLDTLGAAVFLGKEANNGGAYVTFGSGKNVWIGEVPPRTVAWPSMLQLGGMNGIRAVGRNGTIFGYMCSPTQTTDFRFYADVRANSFIVDSDSRIKANVKELPHTADQLCSLSPISYTLTAQSAEKVAGLDLSSEQTVSSETPSMPSDRLRFGFMAQEVQELFPELVTEGEDGTLGIDYIGFIPILVNAIKDLRALAAEQQKEIADLYGENRGLRKASASVNGTSASGCGLEQNRPNPFSSTTVITCNVPKHIATADIYIYDLQGQQMLHVPVEERGEVAVSVEAASLSPGMYIYALIADGMEVDSKRMIVTD